MVGHATTKGHMKSLTLSAQSKQFCCLFVYYLRRDCNFIPDYNTLNEQITSHVEIARGTKLHCSNMVSRHNVCVGQECCRFEIDS